MRTKIGQALLVVLLLVPVPVTAGGRARESFVEAAPACGSGGAPSHDHAKPGAHATRICGLRRLGELEVSKKAGLGQVEIRKNIAAVLSRDEGIVSLIDVKNPRKPKVLGRYDDGISDSYDGDLAFSQDGKWLFYARQTHQFSKDGVHVLDVSNPKQPRLAFYQPEGGSFRIGYLNLDGAEYVITMDAIAGLVVNRFEPATGALVPVHVDALPALKVGGPASAGIYIDPKDPKLGIPLLYATNGRTGLDVYDMSQPESPAKIGTWSEAGLADVEVKASKRARTVYAASEYWFNSNTPATLYKLDATKLDRIKRHSTWLGSAQTGEPWRINGIASTGKTVHVAFGHDGFISYAPAGWPSAIYQAPRPVNENSTLKAAPYAMDVDSAGGLLYLTDASSGILTILKAR